MTAPKLTFAFTPAAGGATQIYVGTEQDAKTGLTTLLTHGVKYSFEISGNGKSMTGEGLMHVQSTQNNHTSAPSGFYALAFVDEADLREELQDPKAYYKATGMTEHAPLIALK